MAPSAASINDLNLNLHPEIIAHPFVDPCRPSSSSSQTTTKVFWDLCERLHDILCHFLPEMANMLGDFRVVDIVSRTCTRAQRSEFKTALMGVREVMQRDCNRELLCSDMERIWYDEVDAMIVFFCEEMDSPFASYTQRNHLSGSITVVIGELIMIHPFDSAKLCEAFINRASHLPEHVRNCIAEMKCDLSEGRTVPLCSADKMLKGVEGICDLPVDKFPLIEETKKSFEKYSVSQEPLKSLIEEHLRPVMKKFCEFMRDEYIPALSQGDAYHTTNGVAASCTGLCARKGGVEDYDKRLVRLAGAGDMTAADVHNVGLKEVERIYKEMAKVLKYVPERLNSLDKLIPKFPNAEDFPELYGCTTDKDLIAVFKKCLDRVSEKVPEYFSLIPKQAMEIECVPEFMRESAPEAFYQPGTDKKPGKFMVNCGSDASHYSTDIAMTLAIHEGSPGHHFQIALQNELPNVPKVLRWSMESLNAYCEGWALYTEFLAQEMGMYPGHETGEFATKIDALSYLGRLSDEMLRAVRLVVDTGLHAKGWSRDDAISYAQKYLPKHKEEIISEVERYMVWPGQACGYKIGELKIRKLRSYGEAELGSLFDIREFHAEIIGHGSVSLDTLEKLVHNWVKSKRDS
eukprot:Nk52_evm151s226 gene=Nk52_evmTU151s226